MSPYIPKLPNSKQKIPKIPGGTPMLPGGGLVILLLGSNLLQSSPNFIYSFSVVGVNVWASLGVLEASSSSGIVSAALDTKLALGTRFPGFSSLLDASSSSFGLSLAWGTSIHA